MLLATPAIILPPEKPAIVRASDLSGLPSWQEMQKRLKEPREATFPFPMMAPGRAKVTTLIAGGTGTIITDGNSTWGTTSNAFDANLSQNEAASAAANAHGAGGSGFVNWIGKDWGLGVTKTITKFSATSASNSDFLGGGAGNPTGWQLWVTNSGSPANNTTLSGWTMIDSGTTPGILGNTFTRTAATITAVAARAVVFVIQGNGTNGVCICELQLYEDI